jgi:hypothetical protein
MKKWFLVAIATCLAIGFAGSAVAQEPLENPFYQKYADYNRVAYYYDAEGTFLGVYPFCRACVYSKTDTHISLMKDNKEHYINLTDETYKIFENSSLVEIPIIFPVSYEVDITPLINEKINDTITEALAAFECPCDGSAGSETPVDKGISLNDLEWKYGGNKWKAKTKGMQFSRIDIYENGVKITANRQIKEKGKNGKQVLKIFLPENTNLSNYDIRGIQ